MKKKPRTAKRQTTSELAGLQRFMAGTVMRPLTDGGDMRPRWRDGQSMKQVAAGFIKPNDRLTSFERLEIYNRQYWYRIKDSLFEDYPGLRAILGEERFEQMAVAYLSRHPSESFTLRNLGRRLLKFLEANPSWTGRLKKPALEMARLEWAHIEAFDNEAKPRLDVDSLLGIDPSEIRLALQPHLTLLQLSFELDRLLARLKHGGGLRSEASNAKAQRRSRRNRGLQQHLRPKPILLAVHRHNDTVYYKRLQPGQFRVLSALRDGATLAEACEVLAEFSEFDVKQIRIWFETWAALGWFCKPD